MCSDLRRFPHFPVLLAILQSLIICPGCSVKEDRDSCPCLLEVEFPEETDTEAGVLMDLTGASGFTLKDTSYTMIWSGNVKKGEMWIAASVLDSGSTGTQADNMRGIPAETCNVPPPGLWIEIRKGQECPPIWMFNCHTYVSGDRMRLYADLHKNFCRLTMYIRDVSGSPFPFRLEVRGNVAGYHIDGTPAEGDFTAPAEFIDGGPTEYYEAEICLPRQKDDGLKLDIISEDDTARTFAIGNYIAASGYDWDSADLRDITMEIDYARTSLTFRIGAWETTCQFEVVI